LYWKIYATTFPFLAQINHQKKKSHEESITVISTLKKITIFGRKRFFQKLATRPGVFRIFLFPAPFPKGWNELVRTAMRSSTLTLFMSISGGLSWMEATDPLMNIGVSVVG